MNMDSGVILVGLTALGMGCAGLYYVVKLESRLDVAKAEHNMLAANVNKLENTVTSIFNELKQDQKDFRREILGEFRYLKGRADRIAKAVGEGPLQRDNADDEENRD